MRYYKIVFVYPVRRYAAGIGTSAANVIKNYEEIGLMISDNIVMDGYLPQDFCLSLSVNWYNSSAKSIGEDWNHLITDVQVEPANKADNGFVKDAVNKIKEVTGNKVDKVHADGAYQSMENRELAADKENGFDFIANGIHGKPSRFDLDLQEDGALQVTDRQTAEVMTAIKVKDGKWKIPVKTKDGKDAYRYFDNTSIERSNVRHQTESIPWDERKKRNNVEASVFQYCFHTRNNKTRYRGLIKHALQAIARCAWINMRRLFLYDIEMSLRIV